MGVKIGPWRHCIFGFEARITSTADDAYLGCLFREAGDPDKLLSIDFVINRRVVDRRQARELATAIDNVLLQYPPPQHGKEA